VGAIQGIIEFVGGLIIISMVFVLLEYNIDTIERFCMGMGGFAASAFVFVDGSKQTAVWMIVFVLALNALLHSMGLSVPGILKRI